MLAALAEMHSGTFYLAGIAAVALLTALAGFWVSDAQSVYVFVVLCVLAIAVITLLRRRRPPAQSFPDLDIGQSVSVLTVSAPDNRLTVRYRGTVWQATMDDGAVPAPGDTAEVAAKTDKLLHLVTPRHTTGP